MTKEAFDSLLKKTAAARRSRERLSCLQKCAQRVPGSPGAGPYAATSVKRQPVVYPKPGQPGYETHVKDLNRQYVDAVKPLNPVIGKMDMVQRQKDALKAMKAFNAFRAKGQGTAKPAATAAQPAAKPQVPDANVKLQQTGRDFLQAGKNMFTNPVDTIRRHLSGQPLKR